MMKKIKNIIIIILGILLSISISIIIITSISFKKRITNLTKNNDDILIQYEKKEKELTNKLEDRKQKIEKLEKTKPKTEKEIIYKKIIKEDTEIINNCIKEKKILKNQLEKTNNTLKNIKYSKNSLSFFTLAGLDRDFEFDIYSGFIYQRALYTSNNFNFFLGGGGAVKIYQKTGGAILFQFSIQF
jgi:peptidoglycan hydrolase CwlO-like protein